MDNTSKIVTLQTPEIIENQAASWLARLDGGHLSDDSRAELKAWLSRDERHGASLKELASIWSDMDLLLNDFATGAELEKGSWFSFPGRWLLPSMLCLGLLFAGVYSFLVVKSQLLNDQQRNYYATNIGKQRVETFSDGSSAHLNTDSLLETEFSDDKRIIRLLRGEALFDVAHDPDRPFIVYAGEHKVMAIGTKFVVKLTSDNILVTVTDGKVKFSKRNAEPLALDSQVAEKELIISKGEQVVAEKSAELELELTEMQVEEIKNQLSWLEGQLSFQNEPLSKVVAEVSRYVPIRIVIDDPSLADVKINGRFKIGDTDALLEAIEVSLLVRVDHVNEQLVRISK